MRRVRGESNANVNQFSVKTTFNQTHSLSLQTIVVTQRSSAVLNPAHPVVVGPSPPNNNRLSVVCRLVLIGFSPLWFGASSAGALQVLLRCLLNKNPICGPPRCEAACGQTNARWARCPAPRAPNRAGSMSHACVRIAVCGVALERLHEMSPQTSVSPSTRTDMKHTHTHGRTLVFQRQRSVRPFEAQNREKEETHTHTQRQLRRGRMR